MPRVSRPLLGLTSEPPWFDDLSTLGSCPVGDGEMSTTPMADTPRTWRSTRFQPQQPCLSFIIIPSFRTQMRTAWAKLTATTPLVCFTPSRISKRFRAPSGESWIPSSSQRCDPVRRQHFVKRLAVLMNYPDVPTHPADPTDVTERQRMLLAGNL